LLTSQLQTEYTTFAESAKVESNGQPSAVTVSSGIHFESRPVTRLDCARVCQEGDARCLVNTPPDQKKIATMRDKILATRPNSTLKTADVLNIFNFGQDPCSRSDTTINSSSQVRNNGEICAYPILMHQGEVKPIAAIHIGHNVVGE